MIAEAVMDDLNLTSQEVIRLLNIPKSTFYHVMRTQRKPPGQLDDFLIRLEQKIDQVEIPRQSVSLFPR